MDRGQVETDRAVQDPRGSFSKRTQCHLAAGVREGRTRVHGNAEESDRFHME